jgi:hypothetical protein
VILIISEGRKTESACLSSGYLPGWLYILGKLEGHHQSTASKQRAGMQDATTEPEDR